MVSLQQADERLGEDTTTYRPQALAVLTHQCSMKTILFHPCRWTSLTIQRRRNTAHTP